MRVEHRGGTSTDDARVVAGRYELLERLGAGGMGTVWRARDAVLDRDVAVKEVTFPPGLTASDQDLLRERTRREARAAARLHHPNVVTVHDVVEHDGAPFIVMELVQTRTLADIVRQDGPLSPQRTAQVGVAVLDALLAAHRQGIVHRDVKPGNVLICGDGDELGRVVLTDFGIATSAGDSSITSTGLVLGSPSYIAPERARGLQPGPASDLWSLGATLFTAVEGRAPFDAGDALATIVAVTTGEPAPFVAAGPLAPVISGLLERDPARRLEGPAARSRLEQVARGLGRSSTTTVPQPASVADRRRTDRTTVLPIGALRRELEPGSPAVAPAAATEVTPQPPAATAVAPAAVTEVAPQPLAASAAATEVAPPPLAASAAATEVAPPPLAAPAPAPAPPASRPVRPEPPRRPRRALLPLALAGILLLGTLLGVVALMNGIGESGDTTADAGQATTTQSEPPAASEPEDAPAAADPAPAEDVAPSAEPSAPASTAPDAAEPAALTPAPVPEAASAAGAAAAPAGWLAETGGPGWTAYVPPSYAVGSFNGSPEYRDPATGRTLRVSTSGPGGGKADAVQDRRDQASSFRNRYATYSEIGIEPIDYRGYEAADWEFTYTSGGTPLHALSRVFVVDGRGYSLFFQTRAGDDWAAARAEFERMSAAFQPA